MGPRAECIRDTPPPLRHGWPRRRVRRALDGRRRVSWITPGWPPLLHARRNESAGAGCRPPPPASAVCRTAVMKLGAGSCLLRRIPMPTGHCRGIINRAVFFHLPAARSFHSFSFSTMLMLTSRFVMPTSLVEK